MDRILAKEGEFGERRYRITVNCLLAFLFTMHRADTVCARVPLLSDNVPQPRYSEQTAHWRRMAVEHLDELLTDGRSARGAIAQHDVTWSCSEQFVIDDAMLEVCRSANGACAESRELRTL
jgi:hypothetical protein